MAPELADAFNTCQLSMQLAGWAVSDDHFCERFREEKPFGEFERAIRVMRGGPFPNVAALYHGDWEQAHREKVEHYVCLDQTCILAEHKLKRVAERLIRARGKLGGPITRSGVSGVTAHHLSITFVHEVLQLGCPDLLVINRKAMERGEYMIPRAPQIVPIPATVSCIDYNELSDQMLAEACRAAEEGPPGPTGQRVVLRGMGEEPMVLGKKVPKLRPPQYDVVKALLDAGDAGLTKDELANNSRHEDSRGILKRLADRHPTSWGKVIHFPGITGGRYRIK